MIALGIDPGSRRTGWGLVSQHGNRLELLAVGVLKPKPKAELPERLAVLHDGLRALLLEHRPDVVGMESVFHGPNTRSLVTLGQARGALLAAVGVAGCELSELSPSEIKKAVTGKGSATKDQVGHMVGALLGKQALERTAVHGAQGQLDANDALAVALAVLHRRPVKVAGR